MLTALRLSLLTRHPRHRALPGARRAAGLAAGPGRVPRPAAGPRAGHRAAGAAAGGRRRRAAAGVRPARAWSVSGSTSTFGITLPFTTAGVVLAEAFVAMPFLVIAVEGALRGADPRYEEAAATLGAGRWTTFRRVTLPLVAPGHRRRRGAVLGPGARRVRRHHHLRRQLPRPHPDHAAGRLPRAGDRPGGRDRAQPRPARRLGGHPGRPARPVAHQRRDDAAGRAPRRRPRRRLPPRPRRCAIARRRGRRAARPQRRRQDHRAARPGRPAAARPPATSRSAGADLDDPRPRRVRRPPSSARSASCSRTTCSSRT